MENPQKFPRPWGQTGYDPALKGERERPWTGKYSRGEHLTPSSGKREQPTRSPQAAWGGQKEKKPPSDSHHQGQGNLSKGEPPEKYSPPKLPVVPGMRRFFHRCKYIFQPCFESPTKDETKSSPRPYSNARRRDPSPPKKRPLASGAAVTSKEEVEEENVHEIYG